MDAFDKPIIQVQQKEPTNVEIQEQTASLTKCCNNEGNLLFLLIFYLTIINSNLFFLNVYFGLVH